ncbi:response regulator transcription factor [Anaeromyxobacter diazotrophicus]|uniref:Response regulatory domain-containing protein n=1 Tax=Anaeromyxobacter diazotrophicus TaxID=2590199 RepID=A0A7I9VL47_9BACT|nr:response regulator transcription factor [Anaeromyxobacter diazotrophicus]GEJ57132.1 hypothetical protein AMYX_18730 [Anaeromyxobacter diazotrophicus]
MACAKILLLETDEDLSSSLTDVLAGDGFQCCVASSAGDALRLLDRGCAPAVAIIDVPEPPGRTAELFQRLRTEERLLKVPVVVLTARDAEPVPGAATVLAKPFTVEEIVEAARASLRAAGRG